MTPAYASSSEELEQTEFLFIAHSKKKIVIFSITDSILLIRKIIKSFHYLVLFKRLVISNSRSQLLCSVQLLYETTVSPQRIIWFINPNEYFEVSLS